MPTPGSPGVKHEFTPLAGETQQILAQQLANQHLYANRNPSDQLAFNQVKSQIDPTKQLQASMLKLSSMGTGFQPGIFSSQALLPAIQVASKGVTDAMAGQGNKLSNQIMSTVLTLGNQKGKMKEASYKAEDPQKDWSGAAMSAGTGLAAGLGQMGGIKGHPTTPTTPTPTEGLNMSKPYTISPAMDLKPSIYNPDLTLTKRSFENNYGPEEY